MESCDEVLSLLDHVMKSHQCKTCNAEKEKQLTGMQLFILRSPHKSLQ